MDPITGIGLVASVIQFVHSGINAAKACRQIYQQGSTSDLANADFTASHLADLTSSLQQSLHNTGTQRSTLSQEESDLIDLARRCESCANKLQHELRSLHARPQASALEAARKAAQAMWKKRSIIKIQDELDTYRKTLETSLLYRLSERFDTQSLRASERFENLDISLKDLITRLSTSQTSLATLVQQRSDHICQQITTRLERSEQSYANDRFYQDVKQSLFYPEIFYRQEQVSNEFDGIENSYEWIFDEHPEAWDGFSEWLRTGNAVY
ncbi:MAG: hypothetical protein Q9167_002424 [Letrouitia subvulpina]